MASRFSTARNLALGLLLGWAISHAAVRGAQNGDPPVRGEPSPAEKVRKALDQTLLLDYTGSSFQEVLQHLKDKTKVNFQIDMLVVNQLGLFNFDDGMGNPGMPQMQFKIKGDRSTKVRTSLQRMLDPYSLTYVILGDSVLITTEEMGLHRQMRQRVSLNLKETRLDTALKDLARSTALNMILDPRVAKDAQAAVTLDLDDATLETAVRLIAEMGNLKAVRMGNVLFVTSEARAEKIRKEEPQPMHHPNMPPFVDRVFPGLGGIGGGIIGAPGIAPPAIPAPGIPAPPAPDAPPAPAPAPAGGAPNGEVVPPPPPPIPPRLVPQREAPRPEAPQRETPPQREAPLQREAPPPRP